MIRNIRLDDVKNKQYTPSNVNGKNNKNSNPNFSGIGGALIGAVQLCEKYPMVNVTALDLSTAIVPRTIIETKESNGFAGFEAFRRESSGLVVNCLIPSFIVMGIAKLLQRPIMGSSFKNSSLVNTWANEESINKIQEFYTPYCADSKLTQREKVYNTFRDQLGNLIGVDGNETKDFAQIFQMDVDSKGKILNVKNQKVHSAIEKLTDAVLSKEPKSKLIKEAYSDIVSETLIAENIKFKGDRGFFANNLESVCDDTVKVLRGVVKENITDVDKLKTYLGKAKKLVNWKSIGGLGVIIPLAISMQPINRWITRKTSGIKGAPIYKDFNKGNEQKEMTPQEKKELLAQKFISIGSMLGVCGLSMFMDRPILKNIFQFKGIFPTMDQARIISTATFASRMGASEDKNELREATVRDIATFSSFYFLGDYVAKGIATGLEYYNRKKGKDVTLINVLKEPPSKDANIMKKFWHWAKHTSLKSSDELKHVEDKKLRTICQIGNIVFSLLSLGVFIPIYTRSKTNKKREAELAKLNAEKQMNEKSQSDSKNIDYKTPIFTNSLDSKSLIENNKTFKSILNS